MSENDCSCGGALRQVKRTCQVLSKEIFKLDLFFHENSGIWFGRCGLRLLQPPQKSFNDLQETVFMLG